MMHPFQRLVFQNAVKHRPEVVLVCGQVATKLGGLQNEQRVMRSAIEAELSGARHACTSAVEAAQLKWKQQTAAQQASITALNGQVTQAGTGSISLHQHMHACPVRAMRMGCQARWWRGLSSATGASARVHDLVACPGQSGS